MKIQLKKGMPCKWGDLPCGGYFIDEKRGLLIYDTQCGPLVYANLTNKSVWEFGEALVYENDYIVTPVTFPEIEFEIV